MFDIKQLKNPAVKYRSIPFWSLNGRLTKEELKKQILNMKKMGFGGAFLHSRTGLETEYMSEEWMDLMEYCKDVLKENNMLAYLYDEDRYPSGTCGGLVTAKKEYKEKSMNLIEVTDFKNFKAPEETLGIFAITLGSKKRCLSYRKISIFDDIKPNEVVYCFYVYYMPDDPFYNGNCMVDCMNIDATNEFIKLTHEKYKERFGHLFGNDIVGIFTDEPCRGPMFTGFSHINPNSENLIPYTYTLFSEFKKRKGYSLEERLPELWFGLESDDFVKTTYDYVEILEELFLENFAVPYSKWCTNNNLKFTGHILHEDNLAAQVTMSGSMMRFYEYFDYPGMDNLDPANYRYNVPALVNSVVKQLGKDYLLDELYGVSGWPMKLEDYKRIGDWQTAGGVTLRVPHLCWYTMKGEAKRDCPASIFHQSAWYLDYRQVEDYFARLTMLLKEGQEDNDIAIINPIESVWGLVNKYTYGCFMYAPQEPFATIEKEYEVLYKDLLLSGITCDYIDEGLFLKYGDVKEQSFICGKKAYKTIILNGNINLRKTTLDALKAFIKQGGKVIIVSRYPTYLDGERYDFKKDLEGATYIPFDTNQLIKMVKKDDVVSSSTNLILEKRHYGDDLFLFAINRSDVKENVSIAVKTIKKPVLVDLRKGEVASIAYKIENDKVIINKDFAANEELAIYFTDEKLPLVDESYEVGEEVRIDNDFKYQLLEDNFLVLHKCELFLDEELVSKHYSIYADIDLRKKLGLDPRGNQMLQPWFREKFFPELNKKYGVVRLHYEFNVEAIPTRLMMMFELQKNEKILINGKEAPLTNIKESVIDCCFSEVKVDPSLLKLGLNTFDVVFDYYFDSNVEDHYLVGDFGVRLGDTDTLFALPATLKAGNINKQGFGYFGGKLLLTKEIPNGKYEVSVSEMGPAAINVNGSPLFFPPYKVPVEVKNGKLELELTYTRQNTFGIIKVSNMIEGIKEQGFAEFHIKKIK